LPGKEDDLPLEPLRDLFAWWRKANAKGAVVGGLAVALHGRARRTEDVDAVVSLPEKRWQMFLAIGETHHFVPRVGDAAATIEFAREKQVLLVRHVSSDREVDLIMATIPYQKEIVARSRRVRSGRLSVPLATIEDLVILKAVAGRPQDYSDVILLLEASPSLDYAYIRARLAAFEELLNPSEGFGEMLRLIDYAERKSEK
jgi:predicted nucleotidyltransferase